MMKLALKTYFYLFFLFFLGIEAFAQVSTGSAILNSHPVISEIRTYSRYDSSTDNFPEDSFFICAGEENRTIHLRIVAQDSNSNLEISNGGNLSFKAAYLVNGSEIGIPSFGDSFKEPVFESNIGITQLSYIYNITLSNTSLYRITANVTDTSNAASSSMYTFSVNNTGCYRVSQDVNLIANQTYTLQTNLTEISVVVDDNVTGKIIITEYSHSPVNISPSNSLDKFVTVDITGPIKNITLNLTIKISYTDAELSDKGFSESTLQLYNWNETSWELSQDSLSVSDNTITFSVQGAKNGISDIRLGTFSIMGGEEQTQSNTQTSGNGASSSSGGSGTSSVLPTEPAVNGSDITSSGGSKQDKEDPTGDSINMIEQDSKNLPADPENRTAEDSRGGFITGNVVGEFLSAGSSDYCLLIIILLLILWIITLFLYARERKKKDNINQIDYEKKKLIIKKKKLSEKIVVLNEKRKKEIEAIQGKLNGFKGYNKK